MKDNPSSAPSFETLYEKANQLASRGVRDKEELQRSLVENIDKKFTILSQRHSASLLKLWAKSFEKLFFIVPEWAKYVRYHIVKRLGEWADKCKNPREIQELICRLSNRNGGWPPTVAKTSRL